MELKVEKREKLGKQAKFLRKANIIPAELYGHGAENMHLSVPLSDFRNVYKEAGENKIVDLMVNGEKRPVLIYSVQTNHLTNEIEAVDFYQVKMDEELEATVPINFIGQSPAVKDKGGVLIKSMDEIDVRALPQDIPAEINVDLSRLTELDQSIYVRDLVAGDKFQFVLEPETVVISVTEPISEEEEATMSAEVKMDEVVVESEEKKAAREAEKSTEQSSDNSK